jgi:hypothetical protein
MLNRPNPGVRQAVSLACLAALPFLAGCSILPLQSHLEWMYARAGRLQRRNPVIVIPGMLGSKLVDEDWILWGAFTGKFANPTTPQGARLIALPMALDTPLADLQDTAQVDGVLVELDIRILGIPVFENPYASLLEALRIGGYAEHVPAKPDTDDQINLDNTYFQFDYDWRRDNVENARRLYEFIREKQAYVAAEITRRDGIADPKVKFDIIAHSMGGLIARYFVRYGGADLPADGSIPEITWDGAAFVDHVILVGTPNAGTMYPLYDLIHGKKLPLFLPSYPATVLGTMPALYQIMPRERHHPLQWADSGQPVTGLFDIEFWKQMKWGLLDPHRDGELKYLLPEVNDAEQRRRIAEDHVAKCLQRARQFHAALDSPARPPEHVKLLLFSGDAKRTHTCADLNRKTGKLTLTRSLAGDGTVTRASALMNENLEGGIQQGIQSPIAWQEASFIYRDHYQITKDPAFTDNLLFQLLERPHYNDVASANAVSPAGE